MSYFGHFEVFWPIWAIFAVLVYFSCCFGFFDCFGQFLAILAVLGFFRGLDYFFSFLGHLLFWPNFAVFLHTWLFEANLVVSGYIVCFGLC